MQALYCTICALTIHNQSQCHCSELRVLATQSIHLCTTIPTFSAVKYMFAPSLQLPVPGLRVWFLGFRVKPLTLISFHSRSWKGSSACEEMQGLHWVEGFGYALTNGTLNGLLIRELPILLGSALCCLGFFALSGLGVRHLYSFSGRKVWDSGLRIPGSESGRLMTRNDTGCNELCKGSVIRPD